MVLSIFLYLSRDPYGHTLQPGRSPGPLATLFANLSLSRHLGASLHFSQSFWPTIFGHVRCEPEPFALDRHAGAFFRTFPFISTFLAISLA